MTSHPVAAKLREASRKLKKIASLMSKCDLQINRDQPTSDFYELCSHFLTISESLRDISIIANRLANFAIRIKRMTLSPPIASFRRSAKNRTCHYFPYLPFELRQMIWEAAAQPPACTHFFASYNSVPRSKPPAANLMADGGLWTACKESRRVIQRNYQNMHANTVACSAATGSPLETYYRRLGNFNKRGKSLKSLIDFADEVIKKIDGREIYLCKYLAPVIRELYESEPRVVKPKYGRLFLDGGKICKELRAETWYEPGA